MSVPPVGQLERHPEIWLSASSSSGSSSSSSSRASESHTAIWASPGLELVQLEFTQRSCSFLWLSIIRFRG